MYGRNPQLVQAGAGDQKAVQQQQGADEEPDGDHSFSMHCAPPGKNPMDSTNRSPVPSAFCKRLRASGGAGGGCHPSKQEEVPSAQFAPVGQQDPAKCLLDGVADADASELDGSAMRTVGRVHILQ